MTPRRRNEALEKVGKVSEWRPNPPPDELRHIWRWYLEIHRWRGVSEGRPRPLDWTTIHSWQQSTGRTLGPFELDVFSLLEQTFLTVTFEKAGTKDTDPKSIAESMKSGLRSFAQTKKLKTINVAPKK